MEEKRGKSRENQGKRAVSEPFRLCEEPFLTTSGTDIKVYTCGAGYVHAEARKAPTVDGKVIRGSDESVSRVSQGVFLGFEAVSQSFSWFFARFLLFSAVFRGFSLALRPFLRVRPGFGGRSRRRQGR